MFYKFSKAAYLKVLRGINNIQEGLWDTIEDWGGIGEALIDDFYPYESQDRVPKWTFRKVVCHPVQFIRYSETCSFLREWYSWVYTPIRNAIQTWLAGRKNVQIMDWVCSQCNLKLVHSDGWSAILQENINENSIVSYTIRVLPFNYFLIEREPLKGDTGVVFSGFMNSSSDIGRLYNSFLKDIGGLNEYKRHNNTRLIADSTKA